MKNYLEILRERNISVNELSQIAGVPLRTIQNWIYNGVDPTIGNLEKVLNALGYEIKMEKLI